MFGRKKKYTEEVATLKKSKADLLAEIDILKSDIRLLRENSEVAIIGIFNKEGILVYTMPARITAASNPEVSYCFHATLDREKYDFPVKFDRGDYVSVLGADGKWHTPESNQEWDADFIEYEGAPVVITVDLVMTTHDTLVITVAFLDKTAKLTDFYCVSAGFMADTLAFVTTEGLNSNALRVVEMGME